ncbi:MAG: hypothetical protein M1813_002856 [Trichoglossum hirsutum]|nr:MAG: hypothetical protein M1813_002856 [Trichoglossum hirsutum]
MKRRRPQLEDYTVGWVCALSVELAAAQTMLDEEYEGLARDANDANLYMFGRVGNHNVIIVCLPEGQVGIGPAAGVVVEMKMKFTSIEFILMVGIGGGVPSTGSDVRLGDVVVSIPTMEHGGVVQYDSGKATPSGFQRTGFLSAPPAVLLSAVVRVRSNHFNRKNNLSRFLSTFNHLPEFASHNAGPDLLFESTYNHIGGSTCERCCKGRLIRRISREGQEVVVHYGTVASGNKVIRNGVTRDSISSELGGVLCFEMEAAGLMNHFPSIVIRGICDYADSHKNKKWQHYAASTAAAYAKEILSVIPTVETHTVSCVTPETFQFFIDNIDSNQFLSILPTANQEEYISKNQVIDCDQPKFHWIFRNMDFRQWNTASCSEDGLDGQLQSFKGKFSLDRETLYKASSDKHWAALKEVLDYQKGQELSIIIDGLEHIQLKRDEFIRGIHSFVEFLRLRVSKVKVLLTSRPDDDIREIFNGFPCIEYDKERKECLSSLSFDNTRFSKVSKEHKGSCEWLWTHTQCRECYREGDLQRNHHNMLRSILFDILYNDPAFFYHHFQTEYRVQCHCELHVDWDYESLKTLVRSIQDYSSAKRFYLVIDAVDESEDSDRRNILNLFFEICSKTKSCIVKIFISSRPAGQLDLLRGKFHNFIRLQDETKSDISSFARSFLDGLNLTYRFAQSIEYIVENAQGVFLWVKLVGEELLTYEEEGYCEDEIFEFLKRLPTELKDFYKHMLGKMGRKDSDLRDGINMFHFVLFAKRPLTVDELLHAISILDNLDARLISADDSFYRHIPSERRIIYCGGNFLEIKPHRDTHTASADSRALGTKRCVQSGTVQVMHQTVREFFLDPGGCVSNSDFRMCEKDAHMCICMTCIKYLIHCAANATRAERLPDIKSWTSKHFDLYTQYLDEIPLAIYALCYLTHHIDACHQDANVSSITSQFIDKLTCNPAVYLLEEWVISSLNKVLVSATERVAARNFRNRVFRAAVRTSLFIATEILLILGVDVDVKDREGRAPLSRAAESGHEAITKLLLEKGANLESKSDDDRTPLSWASENGHEAVVKLLLEQGADLEPRGRNYGRSPLSRAAEKGHEAVVALLLEKKADVESKSNTGRTPLSLAAGNGHEVVVKLLLKKSVNVESKDDYYGRTPLLWATDKGHETVVKLLLEQGATLEPRDRCNDQTPLLLAAGNGHEAVVKLLLDKGANIESKDRRNGRTPLSWAAGNGHEAVVRLLLEKDADLESQSSNGLTPLLWAAESGHEAMVKLLLKDVAYLESKDKYYNQTPLSWAAESGREAVVKLLLEIGADLESVSSSNRTPLSLAAANGHEAVVKLLLEKGADLESEDRYYRRTPLSWATESGHEAVVKLLLTKRTNLKSNLITETVQDSL